VARFGGQPKCDAMGASARHAAQPRGSDAGLDRAMRHLRRPGASAAFRKWERREVGWRRLRTSYVDRLPALSVATLIVHGADDPLLPIAVAQRARSYSIPGWK
jgi:pimeloyl-ACP methyl ester carboxylesterase